MEAIQTFATRVKDAFTRQEKAIDGLVADVDALNAKITELQNSPGTITPADQATLDAIQAQAEAVSTKLEALDNATPPVPTPTP